MTNIMDSDAGPVEDDLLGDFRPGFTLWRKRLPSRDVIIVQLEGGDLSSDDVSEGFCLMKNAILESQRYITLYDLTHQDFDASKLLLHVTSLFSFASNVKELAEEKQLCMIAVCRDERARNWIRWILGILSQKVNYLIFKTSDEAWACIERQKLGPGLACFDAFGETAVLPQSVASLPFAAF